MLDFSLIHVAISIPILIVDKNKPIGQRHQAVMNNIIFLMNLEGEMIENPIQWPNNAKCAVAITFDIDSDSILHVADPKQSIRQISSTSWLQYDKVAIPRILKLFDRYNIKQTFFVPGWTAETYPDMIDQIVNAGHEVALHGYLHERPNDLAPNEEEYWFGRGYDAILRITGKKPVGYRSPNWRFSNTTMKLLAQENFLYDSSLMGDDVPYVLEHDNKEVIELPTEFTLDDWPQFAYNPEVGRAMPIRSPDNAKEVFLAEFDAMWKHGGLWVSVWHPFLSGRVSRCMRIEEMIQYMMEKGDVWFAPLEKIAEHVKQEIQAGRYQPRRDTVPYYTQPVDALNLCK